MFTNEILFDRWYVCPIRRLQAIPNGDGGFIAMATSLFLYARYADANLKKLHKHPKKDFHEQLETDFNIDKETADVFWDVMRNGLLHQGMPKQKNHNKVLARWKFTYDIIEPIRFDGTKNILEVQPCSFVDKVIELWLNNLNLLEENESFPWAKIIPKEVPNLDNDYEWQPETGSSYDLKQNR